MPRWFSDPPCPVLSMGTSFSAGSSTSTLGRFGVEQLRVEDDRGVDVIDVESEPDTGPGGSSGGLVVSRWGTVHAVRWCPAG